MSSALMTWRARGEPVLTPRRGDWPSRRVRSLSQWWNCWLLRLELSLEAECCLPVDVAAAYAYACHRRRLDEVFQAT
jgi:hypothetical protein